LPEKVEVLTLENQKLKRYLTDATTRGNVAIESSDINNELAVDIERLCWGPSASEGPQKQDLTVFLEYNV
jgi:hypothetical protein